MKKLMAAILCIALALSCMSIGVFAEESVTSSVYTIDAEAGTVSGVKPFTTVQAFEATFTGGDVQVVNVDGSEMDDTAYATENVYARIGGELYRIVVKYNYNPIQTTGRNKADGVMFERAGNAVNNASTTGTGFDRFQVYGKIGTGSNNPAPENTADQTVKASKATENGEPVYVIENDSNNYAYLRSHYSASSNYSTDLYTVTRVDQYPGKLVTTVEFEADKLGNISLFNNTPARNNNQSTIKGDTLESLFYSAEYPYVATSVHFLEDGSVKLGGMYSAYSAAQRTPAHTTDFTWEPGKKYTVSVVQSYTYGGRDAYVHGVYVNGTKIFPYAGAVGHADGRVALQSDGRYKIGSKDNATRHGGGLSSIMIGTAPKTAGDNLTVTLSEAKIYNIADYNPALDADITLVPNAADKLIEVDNANATVTATGAVTASRFTNEGLKMAVKGNVLTVVSADGLTAKKYTVVKEGELPNGFYADEEATEKLESLAGLTSVRYTAILDKASSTALREVTPVVFIAVFKNGQLETCVKNEGEAYSGELTKYTTVCDLPECTQDDKIEVRAFTWDNATLEPLTEISEITNK